MKPTPTLLQRAKSRAPRASTLSQPPSAQLLALSLAYARQEVTVSQAAAALEITSTHAQHRMAMALVSAVRHGLLVEAGFKPQEAR